MNRITGPSATPLPSRWRPSAASFPVFPLRPLSLQKLAHKSGSVTSAVSSLALYGDLLPPPMDTFLEALQMEALLALHWCHTVPIDSVASALTQCLLAYKLWANALWTPSPFTRNRYSHARVSASQSKMYLHCMLLCLKPLFAIPPPID